MAIPSPGILERRVGPPFTRFKYVILFGNLVLLFLATGLCVRSYILLIRRFFRPCVIDDAKECERHECDSGVEHSKLGYLSANLFLKVLEHFCLRVFKMGYTTFSKRKLSTDVFLRFLTYRMSRRFQLSVKRLVAWPGRLIGLENTRDMICKR